MATRWRGSRKLEEQPDLEWDFSGDQTTVTRRFVGPYTLCLSSRPARGSELADLEGFYVDKATVKRQEGGAGLLTVVASGSAESVESDEPVLKWEFDVASIDKPLLQHPRYTSQGTALTEADQVAVHLWEDCPNYDIKKAYKFYTDNAKRSPEAGNDLSANAANYAAKRLKGIEGTPMAAPIARFTSTQVDVPQTDTVNEIWTSAQLGELGFTSIPVAPSGQDYLWLSISDRRTQSGRGGKWERTREWQAAEVIDDELYLDHT